MKNPTFCNTEWAARLTLPRLPAMPAAISHDHHWPMFDMIPADPSLIMMPQSLRALELHRSSIDQHSREISTSPSNTSKIQKLSSALASGAPVNETIDKQPGNWAEQHRERP